MSSAKLRLPVTDAIYLSSIRASDKTILCEHLQTKDIYDQTLTIPYPYSISDAEQWIEKRIQHTQRVRQEVSFAIRNAADKVIGVVSADNLEPQLTHKGEIGYWLAKPYWGQGIMTAAVSAYVKYAFSDLGISRLIGHTFDSNLGSARVLEKNGFKLEGVLRQHLMKDGRLFDVRAYGLLKTDLQ